jgi:nitrogen fixation protein FixH
MPTSIPPANSRPANSRPAENAIQLTGRKVFLMFCAFFGVIFIMNAIMMHFAFSTFGGIDAAGAYRANFLLTSNIAAADRQGRLNWRVDGNVRRNANGVAQISLAAIKPNGDPVDIKTVSIEMRRPADRRQDAAVTLQRIENNRVAGSATGVQPGQWDFIVTLFDRQGERFHSRNRLILK